MTTDEMVATLPENFHHPALELLKMESAAWRASVLDALSILIGLAVLFTTGWLDGSENVGRMIVLVLPPVILLHLATEVQCLSLGKEFRRMKVKYPNAIVIDELKKLNARAFYFLESFEKKLPS